jgi:hypothetical protein
MADKAHDVPKLGHARDRPPHVPKANLLVGPNQRGEDLRFVTCTCMHVIFANVLLRNMMILIACATSVMNANRTKRRTSSGDTFESLLERAPAHGEVEKSSEAATAQGGIRVGLKKNGGKYWIYCHRGPAERAREEHKHREDKRVPLKELRVILDGVMEQVQTFHGNNAIPNRPSKAMLRYAYTLVSLTNCCYCWHIM